MSSSLFIQKSIAAIARAGTLDKAIRMARFLGDILWKNGLGQYELAELEHLLLEQYDSQFAPAAAPPQRLCDFLHVFTKAYDTGGHTRIVEHLLGSQALAESAVLITETVQPNAQRKLALARHGCTLLPRQPDSRHRIQALADAYGRHATVILHIHPYDVEAALAAALARRFYGTVILMYNHADHVGSYGHGVADRVLEVSYFGWTLRERRKIADKSVFAGIPLKLAPQSGLPSSSDQPPSSQAYIAAAGTAYKFKPGQGYSFPAFAAAFGARRPDSMVVVGPRLATNWWWWKAAAKLGKRIRFHAKMPYDQYLAFISQARAYVDSFPLTGGTAFPEIFSRGIPSFGVLTGSHGYSPADQLKSNNIDQLLNDLDTYLATQQRPGLDTATIFQQIYAAHGIENVADRIRYAYDLDEGEKQPPWNNPGVIDSCFYEKIWINRQWFVVPVHTVPSPSILALFLGHWMQARIKKMMGRQQP
jgi:hypothetical protein